MVVYADVANTCYLIAGIILGGLALLGALITAGRSLAKFGARNAALDALIDPKTGITAQFQSLQKNLRPNGLNTDNPGDMLKRTENAVGELNTKLAEHVGEEREARKQLQRQIDRKQDKAA